jgi:hypothetical protein
VEALMPRTVTFANDLAAEELKLFEWVGLVVGVIGLLVGVLSVIRPLGPRPGYQYYSLPILEADNLLVPEGIRILYDDRPISRLTKTYISFWNVGPMLDGQAIVTEDPIRWSFEPECEVLRVRILKEKNKANKFRAEDDARNPNSVVCSFDYLNNKQGALFEVLHTSTKGIPIVSGSIRGVSSKIRSSRYRAASRNSRPLKPRKVVTSVDAMSKAASAAWYIIRIGAIALLIWLSTWPAHQWEQANCTELEPNQTLEECLSGAQTLPWALRVITIIASFFFLRSVWRDIEGPQLN